MSFSRLIFRLILALLFPLMGILALWSVIPFSGDVLLFSAYLEDHYSVFTYDVGRDLLHIVTDYERNVYNPVWSPDGENIAFVFGRDIYATDASGHHLRNLTHTGSAIINTSQVWSPDGEHIAFISDRAGQQNLFVMDRNGANLRNLTPDREVSNLPVWSPDSAHVMIKLIDGDVGQMTTVTVQTGEHEAFHSDVEIAGGLSWSPDGTQVAYTRWNGEIFQLVIEDVDSGDIQVVQDSININSLPIWSPDGTRIAFTISVQSEWRALYLWDTRTNERTGLIGVDQHVIVNSPSWSPDGDSLAFLVTETRLSLYTIDIYSGDLHRITPEQLSLISAAQWRP